MQILICEQHFYLTLAAFLEVLGHLLFKNMVEHADNNLMRFFKDNFLKICLSKMDPCVTGLAINKLFHLLLLLIHDINMQNWC